VYDDTATPKAWVKYETIDAFYVKKGTDEATTVSKNIFDVADKVLLYYTDIKQDARMKSILNEYDDVDGEFKEIDETMRNAEFYAINHADNKVYDITGQ
jgi:hypothetical protein